MASAGRRRGLVAIAAGLALAAAVVVPAPPAAADAGAVARCSAYHRFGAELVDVAKTADQLTVLAQVGWGWHDSIGCYLVLDDNAVNTLRDADPPQSLPQGPTDLSQLCFAFHRFGAEPVDVAKSADGRAVLARLSWGWHDSIGCYLVLDDNAVNTLRAAAMPPNGSVPPEPVVPEHPACDNPEPAGEDGVGVGSDGLPCATRLLTRAELYATGYFDEEHELEYLLNEGEHKPNVSDDEALSHITECLRGEPSGGYPGMTKREWAKLPEELTALQSCTAVWRLLAWPVNNAGMRAEISCVFDAFTDYFLWGDHSVGDAHHGPFVNVGWAEVCGSWIDPDPDRPFLDKCRWLWGSYIGHELAAERAVAYDHCANYYGEARQGWVLARGICGERYTLVEYALIFMHNEARDLGLLPDNDDPVDYMYPHRGETRWC